MGKIKLVVLSFMTLVVLCIGVFSVKHIEQEQELQMAEMLKQKERAEAIAFAKSYEFETQHLAITEEISSQAKKEDSQKKLEITLAEIEKAERLERERLAKIEAEKQRQLAIQKEKEIALAKQKSEKQVAQSQQTKKEKKTEFVAVSRSSNNSVTYQMTSYTASCKGCSGITASGYDVRGTIYYNGMRVVAVPPEIPLGTVMRITLSNGASFMAIGLDRGGAIKGKKLDLLVGSYDEAIANGRVSVQVEMNN